MNTTRCSPAGDAGSARLDSRYRPSAGQSASLASLRISAVRAVAISGHVDAGAAGGAPAGAWLVAAGAAGVVGGGSAAGAAAVVGGACARTAPLAAVRLASTSEVKTRLFMYRTPWWAGY